MLSQNSQNRDYVAGASISAQGKGGGLIKLNWNLLSVLYLQEKREKNTLYQNTFKAFPPELVHTNKVLEGFYSFATGVFVLVFTKRLV
jgi:hypothetical protein